MIFILVILIYEKEIWKDLNVDGVKKDLYEISNYGNIKNKKRNKILKTQVYKSGYRRLVLQTGNPEKPELMFSVHRLVALTFVPNPEPLTKNQVNHINGDKLENYYANLEWVTHAENIQHAVREGLHWQYVGDHHPNSRLSNEFVFYVDELIQQGYSNKDIEKLVRPKYSQYNDISHKRMVQYIGRIRRRERFVKILNNKSSTTIERNID